MGSSSGIGSGGSKREIRLDKRRKGGMLAASKIKYGCHQSIGNSRKANLTTDYMTPQTTAKAADGRLVN